MVELSHSALDLSFHALSDSTRRAILARMVKEDLTVSELAKPFNMSLAAVSKHLQVLERAKFVKKTKTGRVITCKATLEPLIEMTKLLDDLSRYWNLQLDSLEKYLETEIYKGKKDGQSKIRSNPSSGNSSSHSRKKR